jgi:hypothetical protein
MPDLQAGRKPAAYAPAAEGVLARFKPGGKRHEYLALRLLAVPLTLLG